MAGTIARPVDKLAANFHLSQNLAAAVQRCK